MKILEFRAENIKNLKVVEITPGNNAVILTGRNGAGKSAVLDSILMCLTGKKIDEPIRNGEARAEINIDLGEYKIRRIFTAKGERLELISTEGAVFKTPQALLDKILGKLTFDPLAFAGMPQKQQRELLASLVGLDFNEVNKQREALYNERTIRNREIKGGDPTSYRKDPNAPLPLESLVGSMEKPAEGTPRQEISMAEELDKVGKLEKERQSYLDHCAAIRTTNETALKERAEAVDDATDRIDTEKATIRVLNEEIAQLKAEFEQKIKDLEDTGKNIEAFERERELLAIPVKQYELPPETITADQVAVARRSLVDIEEKNKAIRKAVEFDKAIEKLEAASKEVVRLEADMAQIDLEKQRRLNEAAFPIEGLGMTDEYVTFQGKPFSQLSTGEQVRVSTAVAMALNPTLKIVLIREGSLLDKDGMKAITDIAKEKDYQLWVERVTDEKGVGIYLEAGEVK